MESAILYSSAGITELLVAVPEAKSGLIGTYHWAVPATPGIKVTTVGTLKNPNPTPAFDAIRLLKFELETQHAVQQFNMVQGSYLPPTPLVFGRANMIQHPISTTVNLNANMPVGGVDKLPLLVAVVDRSASTGYHWETSQAGGSGLKVSSQAFPPATDMPGAPATRIFFINASEPGTTHLQIQQFAPSGGQPVFTIAVTYTAVATPA